MRLDHIAYRSKDRHKTAKFFEDAFGYKVGTEFQIKFDDGGRADCMALVPPENRPEYTDLWTMSTHIYFNEYETENEMEYHAPPEIFVSDGPEGTIVGDWVADRGGVGGDGGIDATADTGPEAARAGAGQRQIEFFCSGARRKKRYGSHSQCGDF